MGTIGLIVVVVFLLIVLRFVGKILKNLIFLVLFVIASTIAVWYFVPEDKLKEVVGTERYEKVAKVVKPWVDKAEKAVEETVDKVVDKADSLSN